jgi:hypothetical protein
MRRFALLLALLAPSCVYSQTIVSGTVQDSSGFAYSSAQLTITGSAQSTVPLNFAGQFTTQLQAGTYTFTANFGGIAPPIGTGPQVCVASNIPVSGSTQTISFTCPVLTNITGGGGGSSLQVNGVTVPPVPNLFNSGQSQFALSGSNITLNPIIHVNNNAVIQPNFQNSATVTFSVSGSNISATAAGGGGATLPASPAGALQLANAAVNAFGTLAGGPGGLTFGVDSFSAPTTVINPFSESIGGPNPWSDATQFGMRAVSSVPSTTASCVGTTGNSYDYKRHALAGKSRNEHGPRRSGPDWLNELQLFDGGERPRRRLVCVLCYGYDYDRRGDAWPRGSDSNLHNDALE